VVSHNPRAGSLLGRFAREGDGGALPPVPAEEPSAKSFQATDLGIYIKGAGDTE